MHLESLREYPVIVDGQLDSPPILFGGQTIRNHSLGLDHTVIVCTWPPEKPLTERNILVRTSKLGANDFEETSGEVCDFVVERLGCIAVPTAHGELVIPALDGHPDIIPTLNKYPVHGAPTAATLAQHIADEMAGPQAA